MWLTNTDEIERLATSYFKNLFMDSSPYVEFKVKGKFAHLNQDELCMFNLEISREEVRNALLSIGSYKAPGKDGF